MISFLKDEPDFDLWHMPVIFSFPISTWWTLPVCQSSVRSEILLCLMSYTPKAYNWEIILKKAKLFSDQTEILHTGRPHPVLIPDQRIKRKVKGYGQARPLKSRSHKCYLQHKYIKYNIGKGQRPKSHTFLRSVDQELTVWQDSRESENVDFRSNIPEICI